MENREFLVELEYIRETIADCKKRGVSKVAIYSKFKEMIIQELGFGVALSNQAVEFRLN